MVSDRILLDTREKDKDTLVVLYELPNSRTTPWVTWLALKSRPNGTFLGHYFAGRAEAEQDFKNR